MAITDYVDTTTYIQTARSSGIGSGTAAKDIKTLYKATYLLNRQPELVFQQFAQKQANMDIPLNKGDNVEFTRYAPLATSSTYNLLTEGTTPNPEAYYPQTVTAILDDYGNYVKPSSRLWLTAFDPKLGGLARLLGVQSGKQLDLKIQNVLAQGFMGIRADGDTAFAGAVNVASGCSVTNIILDETTAVDTGVTGVIVFTSGRCEGLTRTFSYVSPNNILVGTLPQIPQDGDTARIFSTEELTTGDKITPALIKKAGALLETQEAPLFPDGYYHAVIPAGAMKYDFMNDTEYINLKHYAAPKDLYRNLVGEFANIRFHKDTHPYKHEAGTLGTYDATKKVQMVSIFGSDAFGNIKLGGKEQEFEVCPPEYTTSNPLKQWGTMSWKNMFCPLVLNGSWGVNIFCVPSVI